MLTNEEMTEALHKLELRSTEILAFLKEGKIIVGYEKLGGMTKIINALRVRAAAPPEADSDDK